MIVTRIFKGLAWTMGGILTLVVVALSLVLWTSWGTRLALEFGLAKYDGMIPGSATAQRIDGTLGGTLVLEGVALHDAEDRPLVEIAELQLRLRLGPLVGLTLAFETLEVRGLEIWFGAEQANFGDLGPPGPSKPKPEGYVGPDLPIGFLGDLVAADVVVHRNLGVDESEVLVAVPRLQAHLDSKGRGAEVRIDGVTAVLTNPPLTVVNASTTLRWDDPEVRIVELVALTSSGMVERGDVAFDAWTQTGDVDLQARVELAAYAGGAKLPIVGPVATHVRGHGGAEQIWADVAVRAEPEAHVDLLLVGKLSPDLEVAALGTFGLVPPESDQPFTGSIAAQAAKPAEQPLRAAAQVGCVGCRDPLGVHAAAVIHDGITDADARAFLAGASVVADAKLDGASIVDAHARVEVPSLRRVEVELAPWITLPPITGRVAATAACEGVTDRLGCTARVEAQQIAYTQLRVADVDVGAAVEIQDGKPLGAVRVAVNDLRYGAQTVDRIDVTASGDPERIDVDLAASAAHSRARVVATVEPGERTRIALDRLELRHQGLDVELLAPSRLTIANASVHTPGLRLAVNRGLVSVDGTVGKHADANVAIERFELAALRPLKLPVDLAGRVEARIGVAGRITSPNVSLIADVSRLAVDGHALGRVGVDVDLEDGQLDGRVGWNPSTHEQLAVHARTKLRALDDPAGVGVVRGSAVAVELDATRLDLGRLQPWVGPHTLKGRLDAKVRVGGDARSPTMLANIDASNLQYDAFVVDVIQIRAGHDAGRVDVDIGAHTPWIDSVHLVANAPVQLAAVEPYFTIDRRGPADAELKIDHVELAGLDTFAPGLDLRGHVEGTITAAVKDGALTGKADVLARDLAHGRDRIATVSLDATLDDDSADAVLLASGPAARLVQLDAHVPLHVDIEHGKFVWLDDAPHHVALALADADIAALGRLGAFDRMSGRIDGTATVDGTPHAPTIAVGLQAQRLAKDSHALGRVELDVEQREGHFRVRALQVHGRQHLDVVADVPVVLDLAAPEKLAWDRHAEHVLDVDAVGVDRTLLGAFVELPDDLEVMAHAEVHAHGDVDAFAARGQMRATLGEGAVTGTPIAARFAVGETQQDLEVVLGPFENRAIEINASTKAPIAALLDGEKVVWSTIPLVASLDTDDFHLSALDPLLPHAIDAPSGRLDAHLEVDGTLSKPNLKGGLGIANGALTVVPLRQRFDHIALAIALDRRDFKLTQFSAKSGAGRARATGSFHLEPGKTVASLDLRVDGLAIARPGLPLMKLTTRATAKLDATGKSTEIDVVTRKTTLDVFTESMSAPEALPDTTGVVYVDARGKAATKKTEKAEARKTSEPMLPPDMNVRLKLGDPIYVRGPQANMTWRGKVALERKADEELRAEGALTCDRGRINFLGKDFIIDTGSVTLPEHGDLDPYIQLTAVTQTPEGAVTIDVHGRASRPELRLSSDPPMPESDVFALLVTGSSSGAKDGDGAEVQAKAANLLAAFENPVLQRQLQDRLGIDRVGITFGDTVEQPIVAVGKRVAPKVYLETRYHHNAPPNENHAELHLQYEIKAPSWSVETFIGDAAKGGLELWWRKRFGRPRAPKAEREKRKLENTAKRGKPTDPPDTAKR